MTPADPDMSPVNPDVLQQLRALDPAREVLVDVTSLRAKVAAKMAAAGLDFEASNSTASTDASAPSQSPQSATAPGSDNVVDFGFAPSLVETQLADWTQCRRRGSSSGDNRVEPTGA